MLRTGERTNDKCKGRHHKHPFVRREIERINIISTPHTKRQIMDVRGSESDGTERGIRYEIR